jgi:hypothetical protein
VADSIAWPTQAILKKAEDAGVYVQPQRPYKPR